MILGLLNKPELHSSLVGKGDWGSSPDFSFWKYPIEELEGKTLGIVGFGTIGQAVAKVALAFGMNVSAYHTHPERDGMDQVKFMSLNELLETSDIVTLHCPLKKNNYHMIGRDEMALMGESAFLIPHQFKLLVNLV